MISLPTSGYTRSATGCNVETGGYGVKIECDAGLMVGEVCGSGDEKDCSGNTVHTVRHFISIRMPKQHELLLLLLLLCCCWRGRWTPSLFLDL